MEKRALKYGTVVAFVAVISVVVLMMFPSQVVAQLPGTTLPGDSSKGLFLKSIKVENAGRLVNTPQDELIALSNAGGTSLFYNGKKPQKNKTFVFDNEINLAIMFNGALQKQSVELKKPLNKKKWRKLAGYSSASKELYLHSNKGGGDLYLASLNNGKGRCPKKLGKNINSKYEETMAAVSQDGSEIYFISNRPGGVGGKDIWVSKRDGNVWKEATNLGPVINTTLDESFVWISPDGEKIWFSSQGHQSMGGYDVFVAEKSGNQWKIPQNPGMPVNTVSDETSISLNSDGASGFLVSNRPGGYGGYDIYTVKFPESKKDFVLSDVTETVGRVDKTIAMKGTIYDSETKEPLMASIEVTDNADSSRKASYGNNSETGKYLIFLTEGTNSTAIFDARGYLPHFENISLVNTNPSKGLIQKDISLQKLKIGERGIFKNILFEFGKDNLRPEAVPELLHIVDLMKRYPAMEMEVQGHCDHIGSRVFNQKLSEKRAGSVVRYLNASGITKSRLVAVGKGEDFPVAPNTNPNGSDNPEGRKLNRRTEFMIQKLN